MKNISILGRDDSSFLCVFIIIHWYLTPQSRFVTAHLAIPFPHCGSLQKVRAFQNRVFPIFLFNCQHGGLNFLFFLQLAGVGKEIKLVKTFFIFIGTRENLPFTQAVGGWTIVSLISRIPQDKAGFNAPGVVNQNFRINAKLFIEPVLVI